MASNNICESCFSNGKSTTPVKLCTDCDERLCEQCSVYHLGFKAFKSHHLISLMVVPSKLPSVQKSCAHHVNGLLDFYCTSHDTLCCRSCIPETHQSCKTVLPLEKASANVRNSSLFTETQNGLTSILETLNKLLQLKEDNLKRLENSSSVILEQVRDIKRQLVEKINEIEQNLIESLKQTKIDVKSNIESTKAAIFDEVSKAENMRQEIRFLEEHGTNNQLFVALKTNENSIKTLENDTTAMLARNPDIDIKFKPVTLSIESLGSISQPTTPCDIQYRPSRYKQAQTESENSRTLTRFEQDGEVVLKKGEYYGLTDIAVTPDNKLILCNYSTKSPKVYIYTDCKRYENELTFSSRPYRLALIPDTKKAVVTLRDMKSIQFFNYETMTKEDAIKLTCEVYGIAIISDKLFIGGNNEVHVVDLNGIQIKTIPMTKMNEVYYIKVSSPYNKSIFCSGCSSVRCINTDGDILSEYSVTESIGIAVDKRGYVYVARYYSEDVRKLSSDLKFVDTVLKKNDGIVNPYCLTFNNEFNKLYVVINQLRTVTIYSCS